MTMLYRFERFCGLKDLQDIVCDFSVIMQLMFLRIISANSRSIAESLHHTFHLMSVLANFLRMHLSVASDVNICLVCLFSCC